MAADCRAVVLSHLSGAVARKCLRVDEFHDDPLAMEVVDDGRMVHAWIELKDIDQRGAIRLFTDRALGAGSGGAASSRRSSSPAAATSSASSSARADPARAGGLVRPRVAADVHLGVGASAGRPAARGQGGPPFRLVPARRGSRSSTGPTETQIRSWSRRLLIAKAGSSSFREWRTPSADEPRSPVPGAAVRRPAPGERVASAATCSPLVERPRGPTRRSSGTISPRSRARSRPITTSCSSTSSRSASSRPIWSRTIPTTPR